MLAVDYIYIDKLISEMIGYLTLCNKLAKERKEVTESKSALVLIENIESSLIYVINSLQTVEENYHIFTFCWRAIHSLHTLKQLGIIESRVDSFQHAVLDIATASNMTDGQKSFIFKKYQRAYGVGKNAIFN